MLCKQGLINHLFDDANADKRMLLKNIIFLIMNVFCNSIKVLIESQIAEATCWGGDFVSNFLQGQL